MSKPGFLPALHRTVWILAAGRLLSQIGSGFTLFYAPLFFVNQVGLSATLVGVGLGISRLAGVLGRYWGGTFADSPRWGRRRTLLLSAAISAVADIFLALTVNFPIFLVGSLLMELGIGVYWPATEAAVVDLTVPEQRNEAFAITRLSDVLGLGVGVLLGGLLVAAGNYRSLFVIDGISFVVFFAVIYFAVTETYRFQPTDNEDETQLGIGTALRDKALLIFLVVNATITTYISQIQTTLPLYLDNYVSGMDETQGLSANAISALFSGHIILAIAAQLPAARGLNRFSRPRALIVSLIVWAVAFFCIWVAGTSATNGIIYAAIAMGLLALAIVIFTPAASALVADLAPESLRGTYLSVSSQCWAVGFLIGPPIGGWAIDRGNPIVDYFWLVVASSTAIAIVILLYLDRLLKHRSKPQLD